MNDLNLRCDNFCDIGRALTSSLNREEVLHQVTELVGRFFHPQHWSLLLVDDKTGRLKFEIAMGADEKKLADFSLEPEEGIVGWVCSHGESLVVEDVQADPRFSSAVDGILDFSTQSVVCVPVTDGNNHAVGAIELVNKLNPEAKTQDRRSRKVDETWSEFDEADMKTLSAIAAFAGIAIENAALHQKVQELATVDALTGMKNRLYFNEAFRHEVERVKRFGQVMCLLMIDIDGLKIINDTFGHQVGDEIIVAVADLLKASVREADIVARIGGDEFVVLMPLANHSNGNEVAQRIQTAVAEWNEASFRPRLKLGVSIGVKEAGPSDVDDVLTMADRELYREKTFRAYAKTSMACFPRGASI